MLRKILPLTLLLGAALACALPRGQTGPTPPPVEVIETFVAATLTAQAPTLSPSVTASALPSTAAADTPSPPSAQCSLAIADGSTVLCQNGSDQFELVNTSTFGTVGRVAISSDGRQVAYLVSLIDGTAELWVVNADSSAARKLVGKEQLPSPQPDSVSWPRSIQWQPGGDTIFFDTGWMPNGGIQGPGEYINLDLWAVNAESGELTPLLAAHSGGLFSPSPDGAWIAISRPEAIGLISADGATTHSEVITFSSILTYSEYLYKPLVTWSNDSTFFTVPIPSPDPMASNASATVHRVNVDGSAQPLATFPGNFVFGGAMQPSPDGQWVAYTLPATDGSGAMSLHVSKTDGSAQSSEALPRFAALHPWAPDSQHFVYAIPDDGLYVGTLNVNPQPLAQGVQVVKEVIWTDASTVVFSGSVNDHWGIRIVQIGGSLADLAGPFSREVAFDVKR